MRASLVLSLVAFPLASRLVAQDTRTVTEPKFPAACATLTASLAPVADTTLAEADERKLDTKRIQQAIDHCARRSRRRAQGERCAARISHRTAHAQARRHARRRHQRDPLRVAQSARLRHRQSKRCGTVDEKGHACAAADHRRARERRRRHGARHDRRSRMGQADRSRRRRGGISRSTPRSRTRVRAARDCIQINRTDDFTLYKITLKQLAELPRRLRSRQRIHGVGRRDQHAGQARAEHRRHRSGECDERHHHAQLHQHRRRRRRDQGREHRCQHQHDDLAQPLLSWSRRVDRQRDGRRRASRFACSISRSTAPTTASASSRTPRAAGSCTTSSTATSASGTRRTSSRWTRTTRRARRRPGNLIPEFRDIRLKGVRVIDGGNVILDGYDASRPLRMTWDDVVFDKPDAIKVEASSRGDHEGSGSVEPADHRRERAAHRQRRVTRRASTARKVRAVPGQAQPRFRAAVASYAAIVDAKYSGPDGAIVDGAPTYQSIGSRADGAAGERCRRAPSCFSATAAIAKSSPSIGRASRCSASRATAPS